MNFLNILKYQSGTGYFRIKDALMAGASVKRICESTEIDRWFIYQIQKICNCEKEIAKYNLENYSR